MKLLGTVFSILLVLPSFEGITTEEPAGKNGIGSWPEDGVSPFYKGLAIGLGAGLLASTILFFAVYMCVASLVWLCEWGYYLYCSGNTIGDRVKLRCRTSAVDDGEYLEPIASAPRPAEPSDTGNLTVRMSVSSVGHYSEPNLLPPPDYSEPV